MSRQEETKAILASIEGINQAILQAVGVLQTNAETMSMLAENEVTGAVENPFPMSFPTEGMIMTDACFDESDTPEQAADKIVQLIRDSEGQTGSEWGFQMMSFPVDMNGPDAMEVMKLVDQKMSGQEEAPKKEVIEDAFNFDSYNEPQ